jgi:GTP-binding protein
MIGTPLTIKKAVFHASMKKRMDYPGGDCAEIAFVGKSNAGKSSLINYLTNHSKLAYVSKQPGKTKLINYFLINNSFYLVDLPGYGYAQVSHRERESWGEMLREYFDVTKKLKGIVLLTDIRHLPSADDLQMIAWAEHYQIPFLIAATKADKIAKSKRHLAVVRIAQYIRETYGMVESPAVFAVSARAKKGKEELLLRMQKLLMEEEA